MIGKYFFVFIFVNVVCSQFTETVEQVNPFNPGPQPSPRHSLAWAYEPVSTPADVVIMIDESVTMQELKTEPMFEGVRRWIKSLNVGQGRNQTSFAVLHCNYKKPQPSVWLNNNKSAEEIARLIQPTVSIRNQDDQHSCVSVVRYEIFRESVGDRPFAQNFLLYITSCLEPITEEALIGISKPFNSLVLCPEVHQPSPSGTYSWYNRLQFSKYEKFIDHLDSSSVLGNKIWVLNCECDFEFKCGFSTKCEKCITDQQKCVKITQMPNHRRAVQCPPLNTFVHVSIDCADIKCKENECPCNVGSYVPLGECSVECGNGRQNFSTKNPTCSKKQTEFQCTKYPCTTTTMSTKKLLASTTIPAEDESKTSTSVGSSFESFSTKNETDEEPEKEKLFNRGLPMLIASIVAGVVCGLVLIAVFILIVIVIRSPRHSGIFSLESINEENRESDPKLIRIVRENENARIVITENASASKLVPPKSFPKRGSISPQISRSEMISSPQIGSCAVKNVPKFATSENESPSIESLKKTFDI